MHRALALLFAAAVLCTTASARAEGTKGKLAPELKLDGQEPGDACTFVARSKTETFESATGAPIDVPAGEYALRVECKSGEDVLVPASLAVQIAAGKTASPKIEVRSARLRVEARRNGIMLPAKAHLYSAGWSPEAKPLVDIPANQKVMVAQGKYDVIVTLEDPKSPHAEVLLAGSAIGGASNVTVLSADLSDGGLIVSATMNGKRTGATVRVFPPGSLKDVALVEAGEEVRLPAGRYTVATELRDTADFTTKKREVWMRAGQIQKIAEGFESGTLSVSVMRDGKPVEATVLLSIPKAADFFNHFAAPGTVTLSPGTYVVSVSSPLLGPLKPPVQEVKLARAQSARVAFDLTQASLAVKVMKSGKPIDADVRVREAGGGEDVGAPESSGLFRLWPGRYEVLARLEEGDEVLDGPFEVKLGEKVTRTINVVRAQLTVMTTRGKSAAADAEVLVFRPGAAKPSARGRSGAKLEVLPGVYDVKVTAGADVIWKEGVKVKTTQVVHVALPAESHEEALPEGELAAPSDDLPEGDEPAKTPDAKTPDAGTRD